MSRRLTLAVVLLSLTWVGCASALREPPSLDEIASSAEVQSTTAPLGEAERLWAQRTMGSVLQAAERFKAAVNERTVQKQAIIGATRSKLWIADHHEDPERRLGEAVESVDLAQWCGRVDPKEIECDYLLALALGLQAQEKRSTALDALPRIVKLLEGVIEQSPLLDSAGGHRVLALVYLRAPGWPAGPGDPDLGFEQAQKAVELVPEHPPNQMALGEALRKLDEADRSRDAYRAAQLAAAERLATGDPDASEWLELATKALERLDNR